MKKTLLVMTGLSLSLLNGAYAQCPSVTTLQEVRDIFKHGLHPKEGWILDKTDITKDLFSLKSKNVIIEMPSSKDTKEGLECTYEVKFSKSLDEAVISLGSFTLLELK